MSVGLLSIITIKILEFLQNPETSSIHDFDENNNTKYYKLQNNRMKKCVSLLDFNKIALIFTKSRFKRFGLSPKSGIISQKSEVMQPKKGL